ncbi:MAG TPA: hypothetical protein VMT16_02045 [Thermoanaerobaculia bacterium]|nr:hypothetical protein [Thermoanaerobaculia bacterium]
MRRFLYLRLLRASLVAGALYDLAFAAVMLLAPELPGRWLALPLPGEDFYLWLMAILLTMLALLYLKAAQDPRRYSAVIVLAIAGRAAGGVAFALAARQRPDLAGLWPLAAADLGFAVLHGWFWWPQRA